MDVEGIKNVSVIGAGLVGHGICQVFVTRGCNVTLLDTIPDLLSKAVEKIRSNLSTMVQRGIGRSEETVYKLKGILEIEIDGKTYRMEPGTFSLIPSRKKHPGKVVSKEPWVGICVFCDQCRIIKEHTDLRFETDGEMK